MLCTVAQGRPGRCPARLKNCLRHLTFSLALLRKSNLYFLNSNLVSLKDDESFAFLKNKQAAEANPDRSRLVVKYSHKNSFLCLSVLLSHEKQTLRTKDRPETKTPRGPVGAFRSQTLVSAPGLTGRSRVRPCVSCPDVLGMNHWAPPEKAFLGPRDIPGRWESSLCPQPLPSCGSSSAWPWC